MESPQEFLMNYLTNVTGLDKEGKALLAYLRSGKLGTGEDVLKAVADLESQRYGGGGRAVVDTDEIIDEAPKFIGKDFLMYDDKLLRSRLR